MPFRLPGPFEVIGPNGPQFTRRDNVIAYRPHARTDPPAHQPGAVTRAGELLRALRLDADLTQEELAERAGLTARTIRNIETARATPRASTLVLLAGALRLDAEERHQLVGPAGAAHREPVADATTVPPRDREALIPAQLPAQAGGFVGRLAEVATLDRVIGKPTGAVLRMAVVTGPSGIGKTALATRWAHRFAAEFPDGQLYVDLRGSGSAGSPLDARTVLRRFLTALGRPVTEIPADLDERAAFYRTVVAARRLLVVLDDVSPAYPIEQLLPGTGSSAVVATSVRPIDRLTADLGVPQVPVAPLNDVEAREVVSRIAGPEAAARWEDRVRYLVAASRGYPRSLRAGAAALAAPSFERWGRASRAFSRAHWPTRPVPVPPCSG
jgi:transcriptional regulator with XRE-family HTH domain